MLELDPDGDRGGRAPGICAEQPVPEVEAPGGAAPTVEAQETSGRGCRVGCAGCAWERGPGWRTIWEL